VKHGEKEVPRFENSRWIPVTSLEQWERESIEQLSQTVSSLAEEARSVRAYNMLDEGCANGCCVDDILCEIDHADSGHRRRRSASEVFRLDDYAHRWSHLQSLIAGKRQALIVVKHGVHAFNPERIDRPVQRDPEPKRVLHADRCPPNMRHSAVDPTAVVGAEAIELVHRNRFTMNSGLSDGGARWTL
jgi:hypothetical protein